MIVLSEKNIQIEYLPQQACLIQTWNGYLSSADFRKAIDSTVEFAKKNNVAAILSNTQQQGAVKKEDSNYAASVMPELVKHGLKKMAFVLPENVFAQIAVDNFKENSKDSLIRYFASEAKAKEWIGQEQQAVV
jgi:hypothetical protein